ncbi:MAG: O-antigen ligase family protein, partial [Limisphaerales bacterium]
MDFAALLLGLVLYYIRPQEWMLAIQPFKPVTLVMALAVIGVASRTGLSWRQLFKTPHDWLVLAYCVWMVVSSPNTKETFHSVYPLFLFYIVAVQALINLKRITQFLTVWTLMIFAVAGLGLLSQYGFDPTGAQDVTNYLFRGRLALGTSIFRNPNALGHSIVPVVLMIYFMFFWKRPVFVKIGSLPLFMVPLYCIYLTLSKGAFLSGFATAVAALTFGRPKIVQILIVAFALTSGWTAMQMLPRMNEMKKTKTDEAIQGRVAAFTFGIETFKRSYTGLGKDSFARNMNRYTGLSKAPHSSYVQIGAELGKVGFVLFMGVLYCCLRTLFTAKSRDDGEERIRRVLFTMIISYMISSWMVDFAYRVAFFLCVGAIAAYHRLLLEPQKAEDHVPEETEEVASIPSLPIPALNPVPAVNAPVLANQNRL